MKKFISILVSLLLAASATTVALAGDTVISPISNNKVDLALAITETAEVAEEAAEETVAEEVEEAAETPYKTDFAYNTDWLEENAVAGELEAVPTMAGTLIGSETGWGENASTGRAAAFDGNVDTFFDPPTASVDYAGIDAGAKVVITKLVIHPRTNELGRFNGATIEAANKADFSDAVTLFVSDAAAEEVGYIDVTESIDASVNTGYRYFRYINYTEHGDVAEVELYGYVVGAADPEVVEIVAEEATEETAVEETAEEVVEETTEEVAAEEVVEEATEAVVEETAEEAAIEDTAIVEEAVPEITNKTAFVYDEEWVAANVVANAVLDPVPVVEEVAEEVVEEVVEEAAEEVAAEEVVEEAVAEEVVEEAAEEAVAEEATEEVAE